MSREFEAFQRDLLQSLHRALRIPDHMMPEEGWPPRAKPQISDQAALDHAQVWARITGRPTPVLFKIWDEVQPAEDSMRKHPKGHQEMTTLGWAWLEHLGLMPRLREFSPDKRWEIITAANERAAYHEREFEIARAARSLPNLSQWYKFFSRMERSQGRTPMAYGRFVLDLKREWIRHHARQERDEWLRNLSVKP